MREFSWCAALGLQFGDLGCWGKDCVLFGSVSVRAARRIIGFRVFGMCLVRVCVRMYKGLWRGASGTLQLFRYQSLRLWGFGLKGLGFREFGCLQLWFRVRTRV